VVPIVILWKIEQKSVSIVAPQLNDANDFSPSDSRFLLQSVFDSLIPYEEKDSSCGLHSIHLNPVYFLVKMR